MDFIKDDLRPKLKTKTKISRPKIKEEVKLKLWLNAGGLCSFRGCSQSVTTHNLTFEETNFSNIAHIVGFNVDGPRGQSELPQDQRNNYENLILVCIKCHTLIDSKVNESSYPVELLQKFKDEHESDVARAIELVKARQKTQLVRCHANVLNEQVQITFEQMVQATAPKYAQSKKFIDIDMTRTPGLDSNAYWELKRNEISRVIADSLSRGGAEVEINHLSVFALGPMPLLIHLGSCLPNKIQTDLFQRHRDTESWSWKENTEQVRFAINKIKEGDTVQVLLLLSLSGKIHLESIDAGLAKSATIYEISLVDLNPTPTFLNDKKTLENFKMIFRNAISLIAANHAGLEKICLFPAVPAPIAVLCGRELLQKVDPTLAVFDYDKKKGTFEFALEVNNGRK